MIRCQTRPAREYRDTIARLSNAGGRNHTASNRLRPRHLQLNILVARPRHTNVAETTQGVPVLVMLASISICYGDLFLVVQEENEKIKKIIPISNRFMKLTIRRCKYEIQIHSTTSHARPQRAQPAARNRLFYLIFSIRYSRIRLYNLCCWWKTLFCFQLDLYLVVHRMHYVNLCFFPHLTYLFLLAFCCVVEVYLT